MGQSKLSLSSAYFLAVGIIFTTAARCNAFSVSSPGTSSSSVTSSSIPTPEQREEVVRTYFDGVNKKDRDQIRSCFADQAEITDVCALNASKRSVDSGVLAERCMEFVTAHPDCKVEFHYPPTCGRNNNWVFAHWYETGTWSGDSRGIKATGNPMEVEGQTRFYVNDELKITEFVVTRTFTEWEDTLQKQS